MAMIETSARGLRWGARSWLAAAVAAVLCAAPQLAPRSTARGSASDVDARSAAQPADAPRVVDLGPPMPPAGDVTGAVRLALVRRGPHAGDVVALDRASGRLTQTDGGGALVRAWGARGSRDGLLLAPVDVAADDAGGLWVADAGRRTLERFDDAGRFAGRVVLGGPDAPRRVVALPGGGLMVLAGRGLLPVGPDGTVGAALRLGFEPLALAPLPGGELAALAADARGPIVRLLSPDGRVRTSWPLASGDFPVLRPADLVAAPDGTLLVADADADRIVRVGADGTALAAWGGQGFGGGSFEPGCCFGPSSLAVAADGSVLAADDGLGLVQRFTPDGAFAAEWGGTSRQPGRFNHPADVALAANGDPIVLDADAFRIQRLAPDGAPRWTAGHYGDGPAELGADTASRYASQRGPTSLAVGPGDAIVVLDVWNRRIQRFDGDGGYLGEIPVPLDVPGTRDVDAIVAVGPEGAPNAGAVHLLAPETGRVLRLAVGGGIDAEWSLDDAFDAPGEPRAMAIGPDGTVWLVAGAALAGIAPDGTLLAERPLEGFDAFCAPEGPVRLAVGGAPARAYVAQSDCSEVLAYELSGALWGTLGAAHELRGAGLGRPMGLTVDPSGALWVADAADDRVRRLDAAPGSDPSAAIGAAQPTGARDLSWAADVAAGAGQGLWLARTDVASDAAWVDAFGPDGGWLARRRYRCYPLPEPGREAEPRRPLDHGIGPEVRIDAAGDTLVVSIVDPRGPSCVLLAGDDGSVSSQIALTDTARIRDMAAHQGDPEAPYPRRVWLARDGLPVMAFDPVGGARLPDLPLAADALAVLPDGGLLAVLDGGDEIARVAPDGAVAARWPSPNRAFAPHVAAGEDGTMYVGAGPTVEVRDAGGALVDRWTLDAPVRGLAADADGRVLALVGAVLPEALVRLDGSNGTDATDGSAAEPARAIRIDRSARHAGRWVAEWPTGGPDAPPAAPDADPPSARYRFTCPPDPLSVGCSARLEGHVAAAPGDVLALAVDGGARLWLGDRLVLDAWDAARVDRVVRVPDGGAGTADPGVAPDSDGSAALRLEVNRGDGAAIEVRLAVERGGVYLPVGWR